MHAALRNILGTHVKQAGSLVAPDRLRFDFSHFAPVDPAELTDIEQQVNEQIRQNAEIATDVTTLDDALASGALAFFGDRYPEQNVRVVTIPDPPSPRGFYSKELCGGTHVRRSGDIGVFKIAVEQSVASGIRRIEALTGEGALADYQRARRAAGGGGGAAARRRRRGRRGAGAPGAGPKTGRKAARSRRSARRRSRKLDTLLEQMRTVKDVRVLAAEMEGLDREGLRELVDPLRQKMGPGVFVLAAVEDGEGGSACQRDQGPDQPPARRKDYPVCCQGIRGTRRRSARPGRGWRKRHIQPKKCPRPGLPPHRADAIILLALETFSVG